MARAGLRALEFYDPATQKHGQAHMQARYVTFEVSFSSAQLPSSQTRHHPISDQLWCRSTARGARRKWQIGEPLRSSAYNMQLYNSVMLTRFLQVDRAKVLAEGKDVVGKLLVELQVLKSTADGPGSKEFYNKLTKPIAGWEGEIRDIVLQKKLVRIQKMSLGVPADSHSFTA